MPELPDLEVIRSFLEDHVLQKEIVDVQVPKPICIRTGKQQFIDGLKNHKFTRISRRGKFLLLHVDNSVLAINFMISGRLKYNEEKGVLSKKIHFSIDFEDGNQLWYFDQKRMGKIYLTTDLNSIPQWRELGPDILEISLEDFQNRIKRYRSSVKDLLRNQRFITGIGNAYSDEILFNAGIYPFKKRGELNEREIETLYSSAREILIDAIKKLRIRVGGVIETEIRDFLKVHNKGGEPCPKCGNPIKEITVDRRTINYCRNCQV